jgi:hypothetical protein
MEGSGSRSGSVKIITDPDSGGPKDTDLDPTPAEDEERRIILDVVTKTMDLDIGRSDTMMWTFVGILVNHHPRYLQKKGAKYLKTDLLLLLQDSLSQSLILFRYSLSKKG